MDFFSQITSQTIVLTPNRRLASVISKQYSQWQITKGKSSWQTLNVLPLYPTWLNQIWKTFVAKEMLECATLLTSHQENILWEKILRDTPDYEYLLQLTETAKLAKSAWETLKRWRITLDHQELSLTEDSAAFLVWAKQFQVICQQQNWIDQNSLADVITDYIQKNLIILPKHIILVGFTDIAPQYLHLLKLCEYKGSHVIDYHASSRNQSAYCISLTDTDSEILTMARYAKSLLNKSDSIGCVIPNLESQREPIYSIFSEVVGDNQFNISAGKKLNSYSIIHTALQILQLNTKTISLQTLSNLLRSPFLGEAEREQYKRAQFEAHLRLTNTSIFSLEQFIHSQENHFFTEMCPKLSQRMSLFFQEIHMTPTTLPISHWVPLFVRLLNILGWPGERSLNSHEYQVVQNCWLPLLSEYQTFDKILPPQTYQTALHYLICLTANTPFQPESPAAPIQILGMLEAADIPFEYLWVMGLDDTTWPSRAKPNPFIPLRIQKALNMPNASAERELIYCQKLTHQLSNSSTHVIFSYPTIRDDTELRPSALLKKIPFISLDQLRISEFIPAAIHIFSSQDLHLFQDEKAPMVSDVEKIQGGVSIFKKQAECPFKAFAELRLHAKKIEDITLGLRPQDRGSIVHKALELIWTDLQDLSTLTLKTDDELRLIIHEHAREAINSILINHKENAPRFFSLELKRLEKILWNWLQIEKSRAPFKIISKEENITANIGQLSVNLRIDRIDELADGTQIIIDYKTGKYNECKKWFSDRPDEPQLPLYCITRPEKTVGIAFAEIHPSQMAMTGVSKMPLPPMKVLGDIKQADAILWDEQIKHWSMHLAKLGDDFFHGEAKVDPKEGHLTCRQCHLQPLCRFHELDHEILENE